EPHGLQLGRVLARRIKLIRPDRPDLDDPSVTEEEFAYLVRRFVRPIGLHHLDGRGREWLVRCEMGEQERPDPVELLRDSEPRGCARPGSPGAGVEWRPYFVVERSEFDPSHMAGLGAFTHDRPVALLHEPEVADRTHLPSRATPVPGRSAVL